MSNSDTKICIHNDTGHPILQWTISAWHIQAISIVKRVSFALGLLMMAFWPLYIFTNITLEDAHTTQEFLEQSANSLHQEMNSLAEELAILQENENRLRKRTGLNKISKDVFQLGIGGPVNKDSLFEKLVFPRVQQKAELHSLSQSLQRQAEFSHGNLSTLRKITEQNVNFWRHTPSILPTEGRLTSGFGIRTHPVTGEHNKAHKGLDIGNKAWTPILAPADGIVQSVKKGKFFGNYITIDHGNETVTRFAHLNKIIVKDGDFVQRYQPIGYMGNTGRSTATHLHYEVHRDGVPVNPIRYILPADQVVD